MFPGFLGTADLCKLAYLHKELIIFYNMATFSDDLVDENEWEVAVSEESLESLRGQISTSSAAPNIVKAAEPDLASMLQYDDHVAVIDDTENSGLRSEEVDEIDEEYSEEIKEETSEPLDSFEAWLYRVFTDWYLETGDDSSIAVNYVLSIFPDYPSLRNSYRDDTLPTLCHDGAVLERLQEKIHLKKRCGQKGIRAAVDTKSNRRIALAEPISFSIFLSRCHDEIESWKDTHTICLLEQSINRIVKLFCPVRIRADTLPRIQLIMEYILLFACATGHVTLVRRIVMDGYLHPVETRYRSAVEPTKVYQFIPKNISLLRIRRADGFLGFSRFECHDQNFCLVQLLNTNNERTSYFKVLCAANQILLARELVNKKMIVPQQRQIPNMYRMQQEQQQEQQQQQHKTKYSFVYSTIEVRVSVKYLHNNLASEAILEMRLNCIENQSEEQDLIDSGDSVLLK